MTCKQHRAAAKPGRGPIRSAEQRANRSSRSGAASWLGAAAVAAVLTASAGAKAQTVANADAAYNGWLSAYLVNSGGKTYFAGGLVNRGEAFFWGAAYMIASVEDAYDNNHAADRQQLISQLLTSGWTYWSGSAGNNLGSNLSGDSWNDDAAWGTIALIRGYDDTKNLTFLNEAMTVWDMAYDRGWDDTYGGGIWENMDAVPSGGKCGLSNWPFVMSGVMIYQATGNTAYLTKAEQIYAWARANLFNTSTGRMYEQIGPNGVTGDDNVYNSGLLVSAANYLYQVTNNLQYYNDAILAANHVIADYPIMTVDKVANGSFGGEQFYRGLSNFARQNNLWKVYSPWLKNNAAAAWSERRTDYNITHNDYETPTPTSGELYAMETESSVTIQAMTAIDPISGDHVIASSQNGITIDDDSGTTQGTSAVLWNWNGGPQQKWTFNQNADGSWTIVSKQTGMVLEDPRFSGSQGETMDVWPYNGGLNQRWLVNQQSNGDYEIVNEASGDALDSASASSNGAHLLQWSVNNQSQQLWLLR